MSRNIFHKNNYQENTNQDYINENDTNYYSYNFKMFNFIHGYLNNKSTNFGQANSLIGLHN